MTEKQIKDFAKEFAEIKIKEFVKEIEECIFCDVTFDENDIDHEYPSSLKLTNVQIVIDKILNK